MLKKLRTVAIRLKVASINSQASRVARMTTELKIQRAKLKEMDAELSELILLWFGGYTGKKKDGKDRDSKKDR